jgi:hypothetical protein
MVKSRPFEMVTDEYPSPAPVAVQTSGGPASGHFLSSPTSVEIASRRGPRH